MAMTLKACYRSLGLALLLAMAVSGSSIAQKTYTTTADFKTGILQGVECDSIADQLQLVPDDCKTLSFIWVPNESGTISKVCTTTGNELARYRVVPPNLPVLPYSGLENFGWPSRTTVCNDGSCWVANRTAGTVVKIGLLEANQWIDRNNDGILQTSRDLNGDGVISGDEMLPWGEDECVLYEVVLVSGHEGVFYPGTYAGPYDPDDWSGCSPCAVVKDKNDDIWVGSWGRKMYFHVAGAQLPALPSAVSIDKTIDVSPHKPFGAVMDNAGNVWSAGRDNGDIVRFDPAASPATFSRIFLPHMSYGLALDSLGHLFVTGYTENEVSRIETSTMNIEWSKRLPGLAGSRGAVCTADNDLWVTNSASNTITRYDNGGVLKATIDDAGAEPSGISVDVNGYVWACNRMDNFVYNIDPVTQQFVIRKSLPSSRGHYGYNDMTGSFYRCIATDTGTWTVVYDSGAAGTQWDNVSWHDQTLPPGLGGFAINPSGITVSVQSSNDSATFSAAQTAQNGRPLESTPPGRYLKVVVLFQRSPGAASPVLYDLTITPGQQVDPPATEFRLLQAYCGKSCEPNLAWAGIRGRSGSDVITAVPGVFAFDPGGPNWPNFVSAAAQNKPYTLTNVRLSKTVPQYVCAVPIGGKPVLQQGSARSARIRTWWPLMYELPGTKWTLTLDYKIDVAPYTAKQDVWSWQVDATFDSLEGIIRLFYQLPAGNCQVPLISGASLYNRLLADIATLKSMDPSDPAMADALYGFILFVENHCATAGCGECTPEAGIRNTLENPACCKILADADYIAEALGVFKR